jgi:hypothetical protein
MDPLDVVEDVGSGPGSSAVLMSIDALPLESAEEALDQ